MPKDQPARFPVTETELVFNGKIWDVVRETFDFAGNRLVREFVQHPGAVAVVALNEFDEVLLIRQYRQPVKAYLWEIPAGLLDVPGESKLDAAKRELLEETGYVAVYWQPLNEFYSTPGGSSEIITIFLAKNLKQIGHDLELQGEEADMELRWVPLTQALDEVMRSEMRSPTAAFGVMAASISQNSGS
jgi:ADP-ribose pyrophosphatase